MEYKRITADNTDPLWSLQKAYKEEIGEDEPDDACMEKLRRAIEKEEILFYGAFDGDSLVGCCSVTIGFSTFLYERCGTFEDFYIIPQYRHKGIAKKLVEYAWKSSGVSSMTVGCADCDRKMYEALGFGIPLGNLLAYGD